MILITSNSSFRHFAFLGIEKKVKIFIRFFLISVSHGTSRTKLSPSPRKNAPNIMLDSSNSYQNAIITKSSKKTLKRSVAVYLTYPSYSSEVVPTSPIFFTGSEPFPTNTPHVILPHRSSPISHGGHMRSKTLPPSVNYFHQPIQSI